MITMTTIELRTSIASDLDLLSVEMLESVSRYVKRLTRRSRKARVSQYDSSRKARVLQYDSSRKMEDAMQFVRTLSVTAPQQVPVDERGVDALIEEKYAH